MPKISLILGVSVCVLLTGLFLFLNSSDKSDPLKVDPEKALKHESVTIHGKRISAQVPQSEYPISLKEEVQHDLIKGVISVSPLHNEEFGVSISEATETCNAYSQKNETNSLCYDISKKKPVDKADGDEIYTGIVYIAKRPYTFYAQAPRNLAPTYSIALLSRLAD